MQIKTQSKIQNAVKVQPKQVSISERLNYAISMRLNQRTVKEVFIGASLSEMILGYFGDYHRQVKKIIPNIPAQSLFDAAVWKQMSNSQKRKAEALLKKDKQMMLDSFHYFQEAMKKIGRSVLTASPQNLDTLQDLQDIISDVCEQFFADEKGGEE